MCSRPTADTFPRAFAAKLRDIIQYAAVVKRLEQDDREARVIYERAGEQVVSHADRVRVLLVKVLGIPTKIDTSFVVLSLFLGASRGLNLPLLLEWLVVVFISVLVHELGHALVARRFGLSPQITLYSMGGANVVE